MFDYKCTNQLLEVEQEFNDSLVMENYNDDEEIKLLKQIDGREEFYELINSDPLYYLKLLETTPELKGVCEDFDIEFYRETVKDDYRNNLRIKFKIRALDEYNEIGFFSEANDKATYVEFQLLVKKLLTRKHLSDPIKNENKKAVDTESDSREDEETKVKKIQEKERSRSHLASQLEDEHSMFKELESRTNPFENFVHTMSDRVSGYDDKQNSYASFDGKNHDKNCVNIDKVDKVDTIDKVDAIDKVHPIDKVVKDDKVPKSSLVLNQLKSIREDLPKEFLNDYDKMLLNIRFNKRVLKVPSKKVFSKLMEVYNDCNDDAIKFEIDYFLYNNNGEKYMN